MKNGVKIGFEPKKHRIALSDILPVRNIDPECKKANRYKAILSSIKEVGLIEPLIVYKKAGVYLIMDGHVRYVALKELGVTEVDCLLAKDDECYTYNARVNRLTAIQEHAMISKAVKAGVSPERIAESLNLEIHRVRSIINLLDGIHPDAAELLKDKAITHSAIVLMKRANGSRQIEMAQLMNSTNNYAAWYVKVLIMGTPADQIVQKDKPKIKTTLSAEEQARMENEIATVEKEFRVSEADFGVKMLNLSVGRAFVKKLLENAKVARFLRTRYSELHEELARISATDSLL